MLLALAPPGAHLLAMVLWMEVAADSVASKYDTDRMKAITMTMPVSRPYTHSHLRKTGNMAQRTAMDDSHFAVLLTTAGTRLVMRTCLPL